MSRVDRRFEKLYDEHYRSILGYCLRRTTRDDAYSAANEVFTVAWRRFNDMPGDDHALPWLYGVARRVLSDQRRSATRFSRLIDKASSFRDPQLPGPEAVVVQRQEYASVIAAVARLRPDDQEMLLLSAWEGLTHAEIADSMGYSLAAVDKRLARAHQRLKRQYEATYGSDSHRPPATTARGGDGA